MNKQEFDALMAMAFGDWTNVIDTWKDLGGPGIVGCVRLDRYAQGSELVFYVRLYSTRFIVDPMGDDCDYASAFVEVADVEGLSVKALAGHLRATVRRMFREYEAGEWASDVDGCDSPAEPATALPPSGAWLH